MLQVMLVLSGPLDRDTARDTRLTNATRVYYRDNFEYHTNHMFESQRFKRMLNNFFFLHFYAELVN